MIVFLAEDNEADVYLIREALSLAGIACTIIREADGAAAAQTIEQLDGANAELSIALLDLNLPKISGHDIIAQFRASRSFANIPIVVMTSSDSPHDRNAAAKQEVEFYFRKPIDPNEFFRLGEIVKSLVPSNGRPSRPAAAG